MPVRAVFLGLLAAALATGTMAGAAPPPPAGNFQARIRANDAPTAGRLSIHAYFLDSLDAAVVTPGPGRVLAVNFRDSNGKDSFVVPVDLAIKDRREGRWISGLQPLDVEPLAGFLPKNESRWALWWVPWQSGDLRWSSVSDLELVYGLNDSGFTDLGRKEARRVAAAFPWDRLDGCDLVDESRFGRAGRRIDPAAFDNPPVVKTRKDPVYPKAARVFDFKGTVNVAALVDEAGLVTDAFVLQSTASHELNMAALVAVMEWTFSPGTKNGEPASGFVILPIRFSLERTR